ncbi:MAG: TauD/TfdA family dioxygenase, partial [Gammaproteobacteria bacterium]|nr:TauD/TfdA family dioxygenase [Gammaproteobacteria bacterium]
NELAERVNAWFPALEINGPSANRPADGGPVSVLGSTKDEQGRFNADYVPAATTGAPLLSADGGWDSPLEDSLIEWVRRKQECTFMEWHTDATFRPWPTSYAALYCKQPGNSATGFASATLGLERLPPDLQRLAEEAVCTYRPSIIYGNAKLGIPAIASRAVQLSAMKTGPHDTPPETDGTLEAPPHPDDPVVRHTLVQTHPHTGKRSLRFSLKSLETLIADWQAPDHHMPPTDGKRAAWQIMRHATAGGQAYLHRWREGDFIIWDERNSMHCRVPYDAANEVREMWRVTFRNDPADQAFNEATPQLNLKRAADGRG